MNKSAVLLVNLGSPDSASVADVRAYLGEFLMDGRVIDMMYPLRWSLVHLAILPGRAAQSAEAYEKIWTPEGSPLVATSRKVRAALQAGAGMMVELAMRYRQPSIPEAIGSRAALLRSSRLHPGHDGQRVRVFGTGLRPLAVQFSRHPGKAFAQSRPDRPALFGAPGLLR
jgi:hypothetical protein